MDGNPSPRRPGQRRRQAFTLIEMIMATLILSLAVVAVFQAIRALGVADARAHTADVLQSLAVDKMSEIGTVSDPNNLDSGGDFSAQGYPNATYTVDLETTDTTNLDKITVTTMQGNDKQKVTQLLYVPAATASTTATPATGATR